LKKAQGHKLGRKKGVQVKSKLDGKKEQIKELLDKGVNVTNLAKIFDCGRTTMVHYIKSRKLNN